jgi:formamidopyrimidine-DNA glycosylase
MPELPEVETIKRGLYSRIIGLRITDVKVENIKSFQGNPKQIIGKKIIDVQRRAKNIRIKLEGDLNLLFHLKMTGQLIYLDQKERLAGGHPSHDWHDKLPNKHTRIVFVFDNESKLFFNDMRKFGWCKVLSDEQIENTFTKFGPEPFTKQFNVQYLFCRAQNSPGWNIKQFIMDEKIIAGIGNIYANEALYLARIHPLTKVKYLKEKDWEKLRSCILKVLEEGIKYGGTTDSDYVDIEGKKGGMQDHLNVYHKVGERCPDCPGVIEKIKIGGRGTYFCPGCQKEMQ